MMCEDGKALKIQSSTKSSTNFKKCDQERGRKKV
jgi:hypothetical protein